MLAKLVVLFSIVTLAASASYGIPNTDITDGQIVSPIEYPHFVSFRWPILENNTHLFSGSILNERWILTTGMYLPENPSENDDFFSYYLVVGSGDKDNNGTRYEIEYFVRHPDFDSKNSANNIALARTTKSIRMNERVQPIELNTEFIDENYGAFAVAFPRRTITEHLRSINVTTLRNDDCLGYLDEYRRRFIVETSICADNQDTNERLHSGAYGTALVSSENSRVIGIASVIFLGENMYPDVYVRIAPYIEWINEIISTKD